MRSNTLLVGPPPNPTLIPDCPLNEARLKLWWAKVHIYNLSASWDAFVNAHAEQFSHIDFGTTYTVDKLPTDINIPPFVPLMTGDAIRNLRSSLDYVISSISRAKNISDERVRFPFHERRMNVIDLFRSPKSRSEKDKGGELYDLSIAFPDLRSLILDEVQPWSREDGANDQGDLLWRLITSDNIDKHRLITPHIQKMEVNFLQFDDHENNAHYTITNSTIIGNFGIAGGVDLNGFYSAAIDLFFSEPVRLSGYPVIKVLYDCSHIISEIIENFSHNLEAVEKG